MVSEAKAYPEVNWLKGIKGGRRGFFRCVSAPKGKPEKVWALCFVTGSCDMKDLEKAMLLSASFASVFTD